MYGGWRRGGCRFIGGCKTVNAVEELQVNDATVVSATNKETTPPFLVLGMKDWKK